MYIIFTNDYIDFHISTKISSMNDRLHNFDFTRETSESTPTASPMKLPHKRDR